MFNYVCTFVLYLIKFVIYKQVMPYKMIYVLGPSKLTSNRPTVKSKHKQYKTRKTKFTDIVIIFISFVHMILLR